MVPEPYKQLKFLCSCIDQQSQIDCIGFSHWDSSYSYYQTKTFLPIIYIKLRAQWKHKCFTQKWHSWRWMYELTEEFSREKTILCPITISVCYIKDY